MAEEAIKIGGKKKSTFIDKVKDLLPEGGNLNLCLTCGAVRRGARQRAWRGWTHASFCAWRRWGWTRR